MLPSDNCGIQATVYMCITFCFLMPFLSPCTVCGCMYACMCACMWERSTYACRAAHEITRHQKADVGILWTHTANKWIMWSVLAPMMETLCPSEKLVCRYHTCAGQSLNKCEECHMVSQALKGYIRLWLLPHHFSFPSHWLLYHLMLYSVSDWKHN
jgi:hypothetical protein